MNQQLTKEDIGYIFQAVVLLHEGDKCLDCYMYGVRPKHTLIANKIYGKIQEEWK